MVREVVGGNNAVVVAHPDDECLWAGGLLSRFRDRRWTVIACSTPQSDPARAPQFPEACASIGATAVLLPIPDRGIKVPLVGLEVLDGMLDGYDCVVTHGEHGEYGHPHHIQVHESALSATRCPVLTFGWHPGGGGALRLDLTVGEQEAKDRALRSYQHIYDLLVSAYFIRDGVPRDHETYDLARAA